MKTITRYLLLCLLALTSQALADKKISELSELLGADVDLAADVMEVSDISSGTSKKIEIGELLGIRRGYLNVVDYGATGNARVVHDALITAGDATLTSATAVFTAADAGKQIRVAGAGTAGATLSTTILSYTNATTVELNTNAIVTVRGARSVTDAVAVAGDNTFTSATANFTAADIGKFLYISGAGGGGAVFRSVIASVNSATSVELTSPPHTSATSISLDIEGSKTFWGTDVTTQVQNAIDAAALTTSKTKVVYFPRGGYIGNWTVPQNVFLKGDGVFASRGFANELNESADTVLFPASDASAVIRITDLDGQRVEDIQLVGANRFFSLAGIWVGHATTPTTYCGANFWGARVSSDGFTTGVRFDSTAGNVLEQVYCSDNVTGFDFNQSSDTITMRKCGGSWNSGPVIDVTSPKVLMIHDGEWGNSAGLWIKAAGIGNIHILGSNTETHHGTHAIEVDTTDIQIDSWRCDAANTALTSYVRQTSLASSVTFTNCLFFGAGTGTHIWEGPNLNTLPPRFQGSINGTMRWSSSNAFADTVRVQRTDATFPWILERQRLDLAAVAVTGTGTSSASSGQLTSYPGSFRLYTAAINGSAVVTNFAKGDYGASPLFKGGDTTFNTFNWSSRVAIRFRLNVVALSGSLASDSVFAIYFGVPYNRTTTGALATPGIGIRREGSDVLLVVHNGTTEATQSLGTIGSFGSKVITLEYNSITAGTLQGSLQGESIVSLAGGPTGLTTSLENAIMMAAWCTGTSGGIGNYVSDLEIGYY